MTTSDTIELDPPFSVRIRNATMTAHRAAERKQFVHRLMRGQLPIDGVADLMVQHHAIYRALEETGNGLADDAVVGPFVGAELRRVPRIEADLANLAGADWSERFGTRPATRAYVELIRSSGAARARFVAQHYTRLLGDLSGGQAIRRTLERHYGERLAGALSFYDFDIDDMDAYKDAYRARLDDAPWTDVELDTFIAETNRAYDANSAMFVELDEAWPA